MLNGQENGAMGRGGHCDLAYRIVGEWGARRGLTSIVTLFHSSRPPLRSSSLLPSYPPLLQPERTEV